MPVLSTRLRLLTGASSLRDFSTKPERSLLLLKNMSFIVCQSQALVRTDVDGGDADVDGGGTDVDDGGC